MPRSGILRGLNTRNGPLPITLYPASEIHPEDLTLISDLQNILFGDATNVIDLNEDIEAGEQNKIIKCHLKL